MQFSHHLSDEFVQDVLGVFAADVTLHDEREREEGNARSAGVNHENDEVRVADKFARDVVKADGRYNHDAERHEGAAHVQKRFLHAVGAVFLGPHVNHGDYLQNGACSTDDRHALDAERFGKPDVGRDGRRENAGVQKRGEPHAFAGVEAAHKYRLQAEAQGNRQVPAENFCNRFGCFALECAAFKEDSNGGETQCPHGDNCGDQDAEHARKALPDFSVKLFNLAFFYEARHVGVTCDGNGEAKDGHKRVHHAVGVVEATDARSAEVCAEATDDEFKAEHGAYTERHREHHLEVSNNVRVRGLADDFVMDAAALCTKNLQGEKADETSDGNAPSETFQAKIRAGVLPDFNPCNTANDNCNVVDEARERRNQELLARVLHRDEDAPDKDENLARQNDAAVVSRAFQEFGRHAVDCEERYEFLHPDERRHHKNQKHKPESIEHVAEEFPAALFIVRHLVTRENRDEDDGEETCAHHMIQNIRNHERQVESVLFERHARGVGQKHFTENSQHAAEQKTDGNDDGGFVHDLV